MPASKTKVTSKFFVAPSAEVAKNAAWLAVHNKGWLKQLDQMSDQIVEYATSHATQTRMDLDDRSVLYFKVCKKLEEALQKEPP